MSLPHDPVGTSPPSQRVANLWSWLPAFRAVAETEHLPTASLRLHVSASALSRTIRLLEEDVGEPLFDRVGKQLRLNRAGARLLESTREAMRGIDEGLNAIRGALYEGPVRVSSVGLLTTTFVVPALGDLRTTHPGLVPHLSNDGAEDAFQKLLSGHVDVAFHEEPAVPGELLMVRLGEIASALYCGQGHSLYRERGVTLDDVLQHPFACPPQQLGSPSADGWPPEQERRVGMVLSHVHLAVEVALSGQLLVVLPEVVAAPHIGKGLHRLPSPALRGTELFAARRRPLSTADRAGAVLDAVRHRVQGWRAQSR